MAPGTVHPAPSDHFASYAPAATTVFVIDDRSTNRNILTRLARQLGSRIRVESFATPRAALDAIRGELPDLVVTDYNMPELNGAAFVRELAKIPGGAEIPVIVVTAYEDKAYRYDALRAGASDFLLTPLDRLEFIHRARNLLTLRWQQALLKRQAYALEQQVQRANALREREHQDSEAKFRAVIDTVPALVNAVDADQNLVFLNAYHARVFGLDPVAAVGTALGERLPQSYAERHIEANRRVFQQGEPVTFEEVLTTVHGAACTFQTSKAPLPDAAGKIANVVTVSVDVSERKRSERDLVAAKEAAQRANQAKTEFLANISHELRTPLNAIIGFADMTRWEMLGPLGCDKYREYQDDIYGSARQLLDLIEDLLDVSKLELGRVEIYPQRLDLGELIEQEVRGFLESARKAGLSLEHDLGPDLGGVTTDPTRFRQILGNLISNGLKYSETGGRVRVEAARQADASIRVAVTDTGAGMTPEQVRVALSRFGRVASAATQSKPGVGLGLPIAVELAKLLGGRLDIDSRPGKGTTVTLCLPAEIETNAGSSAVGRAANR